MSHTNAAIITYMDQPATIVCDRQCNKAWGAPYRPSIRLSDDEDDVVYLADDELGDAPLFSPTSEGGCNKPASPDDFPNKWCIRQCERGVIGKPGEVDAPLAVGDWSVRHYNLPTSDPANQPQPISANGHGAH